MRKITLLLVLSSALIELSGCGPSLSDCHKKWINKQFVPAFCTMAYKLDYIYDDPQTVNAPQASPQKKGS